MCYYLASRLPLASPIVINIVMFRDISSGTLIALDDLGDHQHVLLPSCNLSNDTMFVPVIRTPEGHQFESEMVVVVWQSNSNES